MRSKVQETETQEKQASTRARDARSKQDKQGDHTTPRARAEERPIEHKKQKTHNQAEQETEHNTRTKNKRESFKSSKICALFFRKGGRDLKRLKFQYLEIKNPTRRAKIGLYWTEGLGLVATQQGER